MERANVLVCYLHTCHELIDGVTERIKKREERKSRRGRRVRYILETGYPKKDKYDVVEDRKKKYEKD